MDLLQFIGKSFYPCFVVDQDVSEQDIVTLTSISIEAQKAKNIISYRREIVWYWRIVQVNI